MTYESPKKNRTNLFAVIGIAVVLVVGAVAAIIVATSGVDNKAAASNTASASPASSNAADERAAEARDDALADGRAAVEVFNTLDYRTVEEDLDRWASVATGDLLAELEDNRDRQAARIADARTTTTATVLDAALAEFDDRAGTARMLAAVAVEVTPEGQQPVEKRNRMSVSLERDGDDWKVSKLSVV